MSEIWVISKIEHNRFDDHKATDPRALWVWGLNRMGGSAVVSSSMEFAEVKLLMQHFKTSEPGGLVGRHFESPRDEASSALNYLLTTIKHHGFYVPPSAVALREKAAWCLAHMEVPDFSNVDSETVFNAFFEVWDGFHANKEWLKKFREQIAQFSSGKIQLVEANPDEFPMRVHGPAEYVVLVSDSNRQKVIIGPYSSPIVFVN